MKVSRTSSQIANTSSHVKINHPKLHGKINRPNQLKRQIQPSNQKNKKKNKEYTNQKHQVGYQNKEPSTETPNTPYYDKYAILNVTKYFSNLIVVCGIFGAHFIGSKFVLANKKMTNKRYDYFAIHFHKYSTK